MKTSVLVLAMIATCAPALAQTVSNELAVGFPENGVFAGSKVENVQVNNGNLHVEIPIWSYPGRGLDSGAYFVYDSKGYYFTECPDGSCTGGHFVPEIHSTLKLALAVKGTGDLASHSSQGQKQSLSCNGTYISMVNTTNWVVREANGTKHSLIPNNLSDLQNQNCIPNTNILHTFDGSGLVMNRMSGQIFHKDGNQHGTVDTNGNYLATADGINYTDTLGRTYHSDGSYTDANGTTHALTITTQTVNISTHLCRTLSNCFDYTDTWTEPHIITLPNGLSYTIDYLQNAEGEISSITFPTGATVSYTYSNPDYAGPRVNTRTVTVNGTSSTWTYTYPPVGSASPLSITVQNPDNTSVAYTCSAKTSDLDVSDPSNGVYTLPCYMTQVDSKAADGTVVKSVSTIYSTTSSVLPAQETTTFPASNQVSKVTYAYDQTTVQAGAINDVFNGSFSWGNVVDKYEYDFGTGAPGPLLRHTHYDYLHVPSTDPNVSNPNWQQYQNLNIATHPVSEIVYDGSGNAVARTYSTYDGASLTTPGGTIPNHTTTYDANFTYRGNLTHQARWVDSAGAQVVTTDYTYDILGNRLTQKDSNGNTTGYDYTDNFADADCVPSSASTYAFLKKTTNPLGQVTTLSHYSCTGQVAAIKDPNDIAASRSGTTYSYDFMNRLGSTTYPDTGQATISYSSSLPYTATTTTKMNSSTNIVRATVFDGLGRVSQTQLVSDPQGADYVDTTYDLLGRVASVSNPHRASTAPTDGITSYTYDVLSRKLLQCNADNGTTGACTPGSSYRQWSYTNFPTTDVYDEARKHWQQTVDGLGRLTFVKEPDSTNTPTLVTGNTYDALSNLIRVDQWGGPVGTSGERLRTFTYDGLSRLTKTCNPEAMATGSSCSASGPWSAIYNYDPNGNVHTRTDGKGVVTTYTYDALNRVTAKNYSDGETLNAYYYYDVTICGIPPDNPIGRLTFSWTSPSTTNLGPNTDPNAVAFRCDQYDPMGRDIGWDDSIYYPGAPADGYGGGTGITYDLAGNVSTYLVGPNGPSGTLPYHGFDYNYDAAGHLLTISLDPTLSQGVPSSIPTTIFSAVAKGSNPAYSAVGLEHAQLAVNTSGQPVMLYDHTFDNRLRPSTSMYTTGTGAVGGAGSQAYSYAVSYLGRGLVSSAADSVVGTISVGSTGYDNLSRLISAKYTGGAYGGINAAWAYDNFGNQLSQTLSGSSSVSVPSNTTTHYDGQNHISFTSRTANALPYDGNGNLYYDAQYAYAYDAENRLCAIKSGSTYKIYVYDAMGNRIAKGNITPQGTPNPPTVALCSPLKNSFSITQAYAIDPDGQEIENYTPGQTWHNTNVYNGSTLIATYAGNYLSLPMTDWQGTRRAQLRNNQSMSGLTEFLSLPYGDGFTMVGGTSFDSLVQFTGQQYNQEDNLYNFKARYYGDWVGRFMSPDWSKNPQGVPYADYTNPQTLNLYSYVQDNPLSLRDLDGHNGFTDWWRSLWNEVRFGEWTPNSKVAEIRSLDRQEALERQLQQHPPTVTLGQVFWFGPSVGLGLWQSTEESMSARASAYQQQVTGAAAGQSYVVGGVKFDGFDGQSLIEAKGPGYAKFVSNGQFESFFGGADDLVAQAQRQLAAANGTRITWHVAEPEAATAIQNLFQSRGIQGITVEFTPPMQVTLN